MVQVHFKKTPEGSGVAGTVGRHPVRQVSYILHSDDQNVYTQLDLSPAEKRERAGTFSLHTTLFHQTQPEDIPMRHIAVTHTSSKSNSSETSDPDEHFSLGSGPSDSSSSECGDHDGRRENKDILTSNVTTHLTVPSVSMAENYPKYLQDITPSERTTFQQTPISSGTESVGHNDMDLSPNKISDTRRSVSDNIESKPNGMNTDSISMQSSSDSENVTHSDTYPDKLYDDVTSNLKDGVDNLGFETEILDRDSDREPSLARSDKSVPDSISEVARIQEDTIDGISSTTSTSGTSENITIPEVPCDLHETGSAARISSGALERTNDATCIDLETDVSKHTIDVPSVTDANASKLVEHFTNMIFEPSGSVSSHAPSISDSTHCQDVSSVHLDIKCGDSDLVYTEKDALSNDLATHVGRGLPSADSFSESSSSSDELSSTPF